MLLRTACALVASTRASSSTNNTSTEEDFIISKAKRQELRKIIKASTIVLRKGKIKKAAVLYVLLIDKEKKIF